MDYKILLFSIPNPLVAKKKEVSKPKNSIRRSEVNSIRPATHAAVVTRGLILPFAA